MYRVFVDCQLRKDLQRLSYFPPPSYSVQDVEGMIEHTRRQRNVVLNQPRRRCMLKEYPDKSQDVLGKVRLRVRAILARRSGVHLSMRGNEKRLLRT